MRARGRPTRGDLGLHVRPRGMAELWDYIIVGSYRVGRGEWFGSWICGQGRAPRSVREAVRWLRWELVEAYGSGVELRGVEALSWTDGAWRPVCGKRVDRSGACPGGA